MYSLNKNWDVDEMKRSFFVDLHQSHVDPNKSHMVWHRNNKDMGQIKL